MKKLVITSLILFYSFCAAHVFAQGSRYAIIVGVGNYPASSGLERLSADNDADKLASALRALNWNVTLLDANQSDASLQPSQNNILRVLGVQWDPDNTNITYDASAAEYNGGRTLKSDDIVLFFFGGHGITDQNGNSCMLPLDTEVEDGKITTPRKLVLLEWVRSALLKSKAGKVLLVVDACRGQADRGLRPIGIRTAIADVPPIADVESDPDQEDFTWMSTGEGKWAYEIQSLGAGVFSHFLLQALTDTNIQVQANQLKDGNLTLHDIISWVTTQTSKYVNDLPPAETEGPQKPYLKGDAVFDFVMAKFQFPETPQNPSASADSTSSGGTDPRSVVSSLVGRMGNTYSDISNNLPSITIAGNETDGELTKVYGGWKISYNFPNGQIDEQTEESIKSLFSNRQSFNRSGHRIVVFDTGALVFGDSHNTLNEPVYTIQVRAGKPSFLLNTFKDSLEGSPVLGQIQVTEVNSTQISFTQTVGPTATSVTIPLAPLFSQGFVYYNYNQFVGQYFVNFGFYANSGYTFPEVTSQGYQRIPGIFKTFDIAVGNEDEADKIVRSFLMAGYFMGAWDMADAPRLTLNNGKMVQELNSEQ